VLREVTKGPIAPFLSTAYNLFQFFMGKLDYRNIEKVPGRCGGSAVVAGTRIRVSIILGCYRQGMTVEEILQEYPHLRPADVHDALAYAYEHPEEIESELAADDESTVRRERPGGDAAP